MIGFFFATLAACVAFALVPRVIGAALAWLAVHLLGVRRGPPL
jgi:hypothetical protein